LKQVAVVVGPGAQVGAVGRGLHARGFECGVAEDGGVGGNQHPIAAREVILLFVFVIARVSYATRMTNSGLIQIHDELEESAQISGAMIFSTLRYITVPLLAPTLLYAWLWISLLTFRELTLSVILTTPYNMTLPLVIWTTWLGGGLAQASALVVVMLALMIPLIGLYWLVAGRRGLLSV